MRTFIEHVIKLTDHRDRDLLELTLSKALIGLLPIGSIIIARVMVEAGEKRWLEVARLDASGGGKVVNPQRAEFSTLVPLQECPDRLRCLVSREVVEIAWADEQGPRIFMLPLFSDARSDDEGVIEIQCEVALSSSEMQILDQLRRVYRNMYSVLEHSDRDALTGLLNRKSLDDAFYNAVLEELDGVGSQSKAHDKPRSMGQERRHRVPTNYWLGSATVDNFAGITDRHGHQIANEVLVMVARLLSNTFRIYDRIYRFGDEHFGVLLHCPDEALVLAAFERFRVRVDQFNFPDVGRVTVSCGFTKVLPDDSPVSTLVKTEGAINFAQRSGGNRVCSHLGLVRRGFFELIPKVGAANPG